MASTPILCVGETQHERAAGETKRVIHDQVTTALSNLTAEEVEKVVIAYEPVWAISTFGGEVAKPDDIKKVIDQIRYQIKELYGDVVAENMRVLTAAASMITPPAAIWLSKGVDGLLVGGASLNYQKFAGIVESAYRLLHKEEKSDG